MPGNYHATYDPAVRAEVGQPRYAGHHEAGIRRIARAVTDLDVSYDEGIGENSPLGLTRETQR